MSSSLPGKCNTCGATDNLSRCSACRTVQYCSRECQVSDWKKGHKRTCKELRKSLDRQKSKANNENVGHPNKASIDDARLMLASLLQTKDDDVLGPAATSMQKYQLVNNFASDDLSLIHTAEAYDPKTFKPPKSTSHFPNPPSLYSSMAQLATQDTARLSDLAKRKSKSNVDRSIFPSHHLIIAVLRTRPTEPDYHYHPPSTPGGVVAYSPARCSRYYREAFPAHLELCSAAWDAARANRSRFPDLYLVVCKELWRLTPVSLCSTEAAREVFQRYGPFDQTNLRNLLRMLDLKDEADDLEGLTNQVAAVLFCQARKLNRAYPGSVQSAVEFERLVTRKFDGAQKMQWKGISIPGAEKMIELGRQLTNAECSEIMMRGMM